MPRSFSDVDGFRLNTILWDLGFLVATLRIRVQGGRIITLLVLVYGIQIPDMCRRHATPSAFSGHYQHLGMPSFERHDSACSLILSAVCRSETVDLRM